MPEEVDFAKYARIYRQSLLEDVVPFWQAHSPDLEHGGYHAYLARDGSLTGTDKPVILQAREVMFFSSLCNQVEIKDEWLHLARLGYGFFSRFCFDDEGRLLANVAEDGRPLEKRSKFAVGSMVTAASVFAEYGAAAEDEQAQDRARRLFRSLADRLVLEIEALRAGAGTSPGEPQLFQPAFMLGLCHHLRRFDDNPVYVELAHRATLALRQYFAIIEEQALFGMNLLGMSPLRFPQMRRLSPGSFADQAMSLMEEGRLQKDISLAYTGANALDFALGFCWDTDSGGLFNFVSPEGQAPEKGKWDMKVWWAHCEMLHATLLAYALTRERRYLDWFLKVHEWTFAHFPDPDFGEWFGYLNRDGSVADQSKGNQWKGTYHLPRALRCCWQLLEELQSDSPALRLRARIGPTSHSEGPLSV